MWLPALANHGRWSIQCGAGGLVHGCLFPCRLPGLSCCLVSCVICRERAVFDSSPPGWLLSTTAKGAELPQECLEGVWGRTSRRLEMSITKTPNKTKGSGSDSKKILHTCENWNVRNRMCCIFLSHPEPGVRNQECGEVEVLTCQCHHSLSQTAG